MASTSYTISRDKNYSFITFHNSLNMRTIYTPSTIDATTEEKLWKDAVIVFDTCALLDFYYMIPDYQVIMSDIINYLSNRIWLPAQVVNEYEKNSKSAMLKPITENYQDKEIQTNHLVQILKTYIAQWEKQYYHPYLNDAKLEEIKDSLAIIEPEIAKIKTTVAMEYQARKQEIRDIQKKDVVSTAVRSLAHGNPFSFSEIKGIIQEGSYRYANEIGPGYKDRETKIGIRKYGDLIIWKEIMRHAKEEKRDVIFITNDTKGDWIIVDEAKKDKRYETPNADEIGNPKRELLVEFEEETGQNIWFYKSTDFIKKLEETYQPKQAEIAFYGKLGQVRDVLERIEHERDIRQNRTEGSLLIRCDDCGELFTLDTDELEFEWEGGVVADRGMGYESQYDSEHNIECPHCGNDIELKFQVWEYPMGAFNYQNIEIEGGEVEEPIDLSDYISFDDYEECERCGERTVLNNMGLCQQCEEEFKRFVNSND